METDALPRPCGRGCLGLRSSEHNSGAGHIGDGHGINRAAGRAHTRHIPALGCPVAQEEDEVRVQDMKREKAKGAPGELTQALGQGPEVMRIKPWKAELLPQRHLLTSPKHLDAALQ